jgi:hypothetical protein
MSLDRGRIERQRDGVLAGLGQGPEDRTPSACLGPAIEAIVDGRIRTIVTRAIAPPIAAYE